MTFEQLARDIIARPEQYAIESRSTAREWEIEAQCYIDNLGEGGDYPETLIDMLAADKAYWERDNFDYCVSVIRSTYGMVAA